MQQVPKKAVHIQNREVISMKGVKTSKILSVVPKGVQYKRLITKEGCSLIEV